MNFKFFKKYFPAIGLLIPLIVYFVDNPSKYTKGGMVEAVGYVTGKSSHPRGCFIEYKYYVNGEIFTGISIEARSICRRTEKGHRFVLFYSKTHPFYNESSISKESVGATSSRFVRH